MSVTNCMTDRAPHTGNALEHFLHRNGTLILLHTVPEQLSKRIRYSENIALNNRTIYSNAHAHRYALEISWWLSSSNGFSVGKLWLSSSNGFSVGKLYFLKNVEAYYHSRSILL